MKSPRWTSDEIADAGKHTDHFLDVRLRIAENRPKSMHQHEHREAPGNQKPLARAEAAGFLEDVEVVVAAHVAEPAMVGPLIRVAPMYHACSPRLKKPVARRKAIAHFAIFT